MKHECFNRHLKKHPALPAVETNGTDTKRELARESKDLKPAAAGDATVFVAVSVGATLVAASSSLAFLVDLLNPP